MRDILRRLARDTHGAAAAEYSLILAILTAVLATSMVLFRAEIVETFGVAEDSIAAGRSAQLAN